MDINIVEIILATALSAVGALTLILLGIIIHEIRQLRTDLKSCVSERMCEAIRSSYEKRFSAIESKQQ